MSTTKMTTTRLRTLMLREWWQHRTGWLVLMGLPTALFLIAALLGLTVFHDRLSGGGSAMMGIDLGDGQAKVPLAQAPAALHTLVWSAVVPAFTVALAVLAVLFQLPGLARRDVQDRSIEFWRSLPVSDGQALLALLLTHLVVLPVAALAAALIGAQLVALVSVGATRGLWAWLTQPWWQILPALLAVGVRSALALLLALMWLSPLLLAAMAASAWLKRWGLPVLGGLLLAGTQLLDRALPRPVVEPALEWLFNQAGTALFTVPLLPHGTQIARADDIAPFVLPELPRWALSDALAALSDLANPGIVPVLAASAGCVWLLWRRRQMA